MFARHKSNPQFTSIMRKPFPTVLSLLVALFVFAGCAQKQTPTPADTMSGEATQTGEDYGEFIPRGTSLAEDYGPGAEGLAMRESGGIGDGFYNGRRMREDVLPSVYFNFDSSAITGSERPKLQEAADYLRENPEYGLLVEGHCDWYGTAEYNLALGDRRANSVRDYLLTLGIDGGRIETLSKGSLEATKGLSKSAASEDRRADLIVLE